MLVDSHCHLASRRFSGQLDEVVGEAIENGVTRMVTIGTDLEDSRRCLEIADRFESVYATVGIHPTSAHEITDPNWLDRIRDMLKHPKAVALGEIGLDYYHKPPGEESWDTYKARQRDFFLAQLDLAAELGCNVVVHQRESAADTVREILPWGGKLRAVFHCYTSDWESAASLVAQGHLISFTGVATYKNAMEVQECARRAAPGSFMVETDAPYLAPVPYRGKPCLPAYTRYTAEHIAKLRGQNLEDLAKETAAAAGEFFLTEKDGFL